MHPTLIQRVVSVTPELIARGIRQDSAGCPVALALRQVYPDATSGPLATSFPIEGAWVWLHHSPAVRQWIAAFDMGGTPPPIDIAIDLENRRLWIA